MNTAAPALKTDWISDAATRLIETIPAHIERMSWSADRLREHHCAALRKLLRVAVTHSPFHQRRLGPIHLDAFTPDRLTELPVMTKTQMMAEFDDVVTDRRLDRALVERHLANLDENPELLLEEYLVLASGGSSGTRGVFVNSEHSSPEFAAAVLRGGISRLVAQTGWPPPAKLPVAIVMAPKAIHATRALTPILAGIAELTYAPVTLPLEEIITRLNASQPKILLAYPSTLARLADAAVGGHLSIDPTMILVSGEQLLPDHVDRIMAGFGAPPANSYATSEGLSGSAPPGSNEFVFASDRTIVEFVDQHDNPVPAGTPAHHVLVTNLANHVQPLIRYRLDDAMTELSPAPEHGHQRATLIGRNEEFLTINRVPIHPLSIRSALLQHPTISEYQVTVNNKAPEATIELLLLTSGGVNLARVEHDLATALAAAGANATITARVVEQLERHPETGKTRRFIIR